MVNANYAFGKRVGKGVLRRLKTLHGHSFGNGTDHSSAALALADRPADKARLAGAGDLHSGTCGGQAPAVRELSFLGRAEFHFPEVSLHGAGRGSLAALSLRPG